MSFPAMPAYLHGGHCRRYPATLSATVAAAAVANDPGGGPVIRLLAVEVLNISSLGVGNKEGMATARLSRPRQKDFAVALQ